MIEPGDVWLVSVGKRAGRRSKDQKPIGATLVEAALAGERVARLKGGTPSIFGRATEEMWNKPGKGEATSIGDELQSDWQHLHNRSRPNSSRAAEPRASA